MFDDFSTKSRAIRAAFDIAADRGWNAATFPAIAERTGLSLTELRREFACRTDILKAFQAETDAEVLAKVKPVTPDRGTSGQTPRDRLFDLIMTRFEVMAPYKPALRRISADLCCRPGETALLVCSTLASQYWMLTGAGAKFDGPGSGLRVVGLAAVYAKVFEVWLGDELPGLDRTMAALDRRLRNGEQLLTTLETSCQSLCRLACGFLPRGWKRRGGEASSGQSDTGPATSSASA